MPSIAFLLLPLSLIPFLGGVIWFFLVRFFFNNILLYLPLHDLLFKTLVLSGLVAGTLNVLSSLGTTLLFWKLRKMKVLSFTKLKIKPQDLLSLLKKKSWKEFINQIIDMLVKLWKKIDKKLLGSVIFWFGLGIASHDFWWETSEAKVDVERPTQGAWEGLQLATLGFNLLFEGVSLKERIEKSFLFYLGFLLCLIGFASTKLFPKGITRLISHFLWWPGISLMVYNWYEIMKEEVFK